MAKGYYSLKRGILSLLIHNRMYHIEHFIEDTEGYSRHGPKWCKLGLILARATAFTVSLISGKLSCFSRS